MTKPTWKNVTNKDRTPQTWELKTEYLQLVVSRHIQLSPDAWTMRCDDVGINYAKKLGAKEIKKARAEALAIVRVRLAAMAESLLEAK